MATTTMEFANKPIQTSDLMSYYLSMNMNNICRICLEKGSKLMSIFDPVKPPHFSVLMMACAAVKVQEGDGLPPYICQKCISRLNIAYQFKSQCEASDAKLRQCFKSYNLEQGQDFTGFEAKEGNVIEISSAIVSEPVDYISDSQALPSEHPGDEHDYKVLAENVDEEHLEASQQVEDYKTDLTADEPSTVKLEDLHIENPTNENALEPSKSKRPSKFHQCSTCGKVFRTKPSLVHHIRIHTGERPYVCHLCQKRFVNGGHLHTHMKTHTGEKNYVCAVCSKGFATSQQLTKHTIAIHTSERPYGCTYCCKRFASSSNLNTHIKIHTGEKNFHCEVCGKTFSTKGQLHQHLLVHTGEKSFLCEYCNKRFSQKAHLVRHLKIHKRTK